MKNSVLLLLSFCSLIGCSPEEVEAPQPLNTIEHVSYASPLAGCVTDVFDHYTTLTPYTSFEDSLEIDIDNDSINDIRFSILSNYTIAKHCLQDTYLTVLHNSTRFISIQGNVELSYGDSVVPQVGAVILNPQKLINNILENYWFNYGDFFQEARFVLNECGYLHFSANEIVPYRISTANGYKYGWFRWEQCDPDYGVQIIEYAFETVAGDSIYPGQTTD